LRPGIYIIETLYKFIIAFIVNYGGEDPTASLVAPLRLGRVAAGEPIAKPAMSLNWSGIFLWIAINFTTRKNHAGGDHNKTLQFGSIQDFGEIT